MNENNFVNGRSVPTNPIVLENTLLYRTHESREKARQDFMKVSGVLTKQGSEEKRKQKELKAFYENRFIELSNVLYEHTKDEEYQRGII